MAWPDDEDLPITVEAAWGADVLADPGTWTWTDLSDRLRAVPITMRVGRSSGAAVVSPSTATITLANEDGALTPLHGMSPWWPHVDLGTPIRLRLSWGGDDYTLLAGHADSWQATVIPTTEPGVVESAVKVAISGVLRRLGLGEQPARSALRRTITASGPVAYYPVEDGVLATQAGSAVAGGPPLTTRGVVEFKAIDDYTLPEGTTVRYGTSALVDQAAGGGLDVTLPGAVTAATQSAWTVHVVGRADVTATSGPVVLLEWTTPGGTHTRWQLVTRLTPSSAMQVIAYTPAGVATTVAERPSASTGFDAAAVWAEQVGGNISVSLRLSSGPTVWTGSIAGTLAGVAGLATNTTGATSTISMPTGHLAVWASAGLPYRMDIETDPYGGLVREARRSYWQEAAHLRLARLLGEDGLTVTMPAVPADGVQRMGWQPAATPEELHTECIEVDGGILYESGYGLGYLPRTARYNQTPALIIDLATYCVTAGDSARVLAPMLDDRDVRNQWTVERPDGSTATAADLEHQRRHGVRPDSIELNLADDSGLMDHAAWRVHLGTTQGLRDGTIPLDLVANPALVDAWLTCQVGSRTRRTNAPTQAGPVEDRIIDGWTATIGPRRWTVQIATSPADPWDVATADGVQRAAADGSTLAAPLSAGAMTMTVTGTWTSDPADMPVDVRVGGERVAVSAIAAGVATITARGVNGVQRLWPVGTPVDVWAPAVVAL